MKKFILIHYSEIGLKKGNKDYFVEKLLVKIRLRLKTKFNHQFKVIHTLSRILIFLDKDYSKIENLNYLNVLKIIFGIKNIQFVYSGSVNLKTLGKQIFTNFTKEIFGYDNPKTFCVRVKRSMAFKYTSSDAEMELGGILLDLGISMKVKLKSPDITINVEFFNDRGYFSYFKYEGAGGMPPSSQGKLVSLISSGIDSPVASYSMMKRGVKIIFVHFHGYPYTGKDEMEQVCDLVKILSGYQDGAKLYFVPYGKIQKAIASNLHVPGKIRTVLYRRTMLRIAEKIAYKEKAKGLVTGDNFGQVASQTPENLFAIHDVSTIPLYQPLISFDKENIVRESSKIGTYDISKLPCKESCVMFMPKHPELKANIRDVNEYEKSLPIDRLINEALANYDVKNF
ncbi:tRNA 4-thiouridine(8) synthase ThiI [Candidatus Peregrinibacteria bacterium]|nr:tRNA 4-thiouridine(8) synthase ThiI [Candidatus Peregrinibacteria bacterium]